MNTWNVLMVGVGGQGIILASDILTAAALEAGCDAKKSEIHGMSQRGGSVFSHIRFGQKVFSPVIPERGADVLLSLELLETLRWLRFTHAGTNVIVLKEKIIPANTPAYPEGIERELSSLFPGIVFVDPALVLEKIGEKKFLNTALCGMLSRLLALPEDAWRQAILDHVPPGTFDANWAAFETGKELKNN